jgi:hypothetical protein
VGGDQELETTTGQWEIWTRMSIAFITAMMPEQLGTEKTALLKSRLMSSETHIFELLISIILH